MALPVAPNNNNNGINTHFIAPNTRRLLGASQIHVECTPTTVRLKKNALVQSNAVINYTFATCVLMNKDNSCTITLLFSLLHCYLSRFCSCRSQRYSGLCVGQHNLLVMVGGLVQRSIPLVPAQDQRHVQQLYVYFYRGGLQQWLRRQPES